MTSRGFGRYMIPSYTRGVASWAPDSSIAHDHASWSWPTLSRSISSSGLYPQALSVRLQLSQSPGAGLRSVSSVTERKSVTWAMRPGLPSNNARKRRLGIALSSVAPPIPRFNRDGTLFPENEPHGHITTRLRLKIVAVAATPQATPGSHPRRIGSKRHLAGRLAGPLSGPLAHGCLLLPTRFLYDDEAVPDPPTPGTPPLSQP